MSELVIIRHPSSFLSVGLALQLSLPQDETRGQYGSSVLGWKHRSWIVCEWPFHLGEPIPCVKGTLCLLRYIYEGNMIGYCTKVLETQMQPFPFLLLAFPSELEEVPLRKHGRVTALEPIVLSAGQEHAADSRSGPTVRIGGLLKDLSATGCAVLIQQPVQNFYPGMALRVEFEIIGTGHVNNLTGIVRNLSLQTDGTHLGLEFRFDGKETIEYRGWGGSVRNALESFAHQKQTFQSA
jgi:c-di-GMP-binding flagellar brake protein YcgR